MQTVCSARVQDTRQQLGHLCQPCMFKSFNAKKRESVGKNHNQMIAYLHHAGLCKWTKRGGKMAKWKNNEGMELYSESVRIKWACAYTSVVLLTIIWSKRNKGGKRQFSSAWLTHCCTLGGWCTAARTQLCSRSRLASDVAGVGNLC